MKAFPIKGAWHLVEHDRFVALVKKHTTWLTSESWKRHGDYTSYSPNQNLVTALAKWKL